MKKNISITLFLFAFSLLSIAQVEVDGVNINDLEDVKICQVIARGKAFSKKVTIRIDYGQEIKWGKGNSRVKGKNGKLQVFNTVIEALNFMENNGWNYLDSHIIQSITNGNSTNTYHYYFKKR